MILAASFLPCDENSVPTGEIRKVENTAMDFRKYKKIGKEIDSDYESVVQGNGYDHNWIIRDYDGNLRLAAKAKDENSKRVMEVYTDLPGVQFYTGNYLTEETFYSGKAKCSDRVCKGSESTYRKKKRISGRR